MREIAAMDLVAERTGCRFCRLDQLIAHDADNAAQSVFATPERSRRIVQRDRTKGGSSSKGYTQDRAGSP
jgi:hypothetical protein